MAQPKSDILKLIVLTLGIYLSFQAIMPWVHASTDEENEGVGCSLYGEHSVSSSAASEPAADGADCQNHHCGNCFSAVASIPPYSVICPLNEAADLRNLKLQVHHQPQTEPPRGALIELVGNTS